MSSYFETRSNDDYAFPLKRPKIQYFNGGFSHALVEVVVVVVVVVVVLWLGVGLKVVVDKHEKASVVKK